MNAHKIIIKYIKNFVVDELQAVTAVLVTSVVPDEVVSESAKEVTAEAPSEVILMEQNTEVGG